MLCRRQLGQFHQQSQDNMQHLSSLKGDLKTVLSLLMMFLDREKLKVMAERDREMVWLASSTDSGRTSKTND